MKPQMCVAYYVMFGIVCKQLETAHTSDIFSKKFFRVSVKLNEKKIPSITSIAVPNDLIH
jgi:hypothetical protein